MKITKDDDSPAMGAGTGPTLVGYMSWVLWFDHGGMRDQRELGFRNWDRVRDKVMNESWTDIDDEG